MRHRKQKKGAFPQTRGGGCLIRQPRTQGLLLLRDSRCPSTPRMIRCTWNKVSQTSAQGQINHLVHQEFQSCLQQASGNRGRWAPSVASEGQSRLPCVAIQRLNLSSSRPVTCTGLQSTEFNMQFHKVKPGARNHSLISSLRDSVSSNSSPFSVTIVISPRVCFSCCL